MLNVPLADNAAVRGVIYHDDQSGFIDDPARGKKDINGTNDTGGRLSLLWNVTPDFTVRLNALMQNLTIDGSSAVDTTYVPSATSPSGLAYGLKPFSGPYEQSRAAPEPSTVRYRLYNGTVDWNLGFGTLTSATSYGEFTDHSSQDVTALYGTLLFTDRLIHASLHAGAAGHRQIRFRHNDLDHLEELLAGYADRPGPRLIVTESVFSMDGDRADLARLSALAKAHDAFLYLDEAHATGVLGPQGRGLSATVPDAADLVMGTFSKALGSFGAYVAGSRLLIDYLVNACGGFIFSTAPPPAMLGAIDAALELVPGMDAERARLAKEMAKCDADIARVDQKLGNADFLKRAPEEIVEGEREKRDEAQARKEKLAEALARLQGAA